MARHQSLIEGRWRIVETEMWDQEALDLTVPAYMRFDRGGLGEMELIAIGASIDYRVEQRDEAFVLEFSWSALTRWMRPAAAPGPGSMATRCAGSSSSTREMSRPSWHDVSAGFGLCQRRRRLGRPAELHHIRNVVDRARRGFRASGGRTGEVPGEAPAQWVPVTEGFDGLARLPPARLSYNQARHGQRHADRHPG